MDCELTCFLLFVDLFEPKYLMSRRPSLGPSLCSRNKHTTLSSPVDVCVALPKRLTAKPGMPDVFNVMSYATLCLPSVLGHDCVG